MVDVRYFASVNSTALKIINFRFYGEGIINLYNFILYMCYAISVLGLVCVGVGLVTKRLAGI